jgi:hypothetical protein
MTDLITTATHFLTCWVSREKAAQIGADRRKTFDVSPTMYRQVEALGTVGAAR